VQCLYEKNPQDDGSILTLENGADQLAAPFSIAFLVIPEILRQYQCADEVQGGVVEDPYQVDKVPINCGSFHRVILLIV
jgi:hypothetical protein